MKEYGPKYNTVSMVCVNQDALCAHSFQGDCTAKKYKHLCDKMKEQLKEKKISTVLGN